ncbi:hypothetical protein F4810DRAFT_689454 [Camillea tinctor]|nr:hypothetical protein F4810DRAFT_689454 [Camillea tinctor]
MSQKMKPNQHRHKNNNQPPRSRKPTQQPQPTPLANTEDILVSAQTPLPAGYTFVPKGNRYITLHCRSQTRLAHQPLYVVVPSSSSLSPSNSTGLRVPIAIYASVLRSHRATLPARRKEVARRDTNLRDAFRDAVVACFPRVPRDELESGVLDWTMRKGAGRVGRSGTGKGGKGVQVRARLAVRAYIRHVHTGYDDLLRSGREDREGARERTWKKVEEVAREWGEVKSRGGRRAEKREKRKGR